MTFQKIIDGFFKDKKGNWAVLQAPNLPLATWLISMPLSKWLPYGTWNFVAHLIAFGSLFTWAWLEIFQGTSYFRRVIGLIVMIALVHSQL